jgi:hypothetical protein
MTVSLNSLLAEADAEIKRGSTDRALHVILRILNLLADGTITIGDPGAGLDDDIAFLDAEFARLTEQGDTDGALMARRRAQMLRSAQTIDRQTITPEEKGD